MEHPPTTPKLLLVWDTPNIDMHIATLVGGKPSPAQRPDMLVLARWLRDRAEARGAEAEAVVFVNVPSQNVSKIAPWVEMLRRSGFGVFARPKIGESDIDENITSLLSERHAAGTLVEVIVASGDRKAFQEPLEALGEDGVEVSYLIFTEFAGNQQRVEVIDLGSIPGLFAEVLPRGSLEHLPEHGALLAPLGRLGERGPSEAGRGQKETGGGAVTRQRQDLLFERARAALEALPDGSYDSGELWKLLRKAVPGLTPKAVGCSRVSDAVVKLCEQSSWQVSRRGATNWVAQRSKS